MSLYQRGGAPSQRGPFASRPNAAPLNEAASAGYAPQGYVGGPPAGTSGGPSGAPPAPSWTSNAAGVEYRQRGPQMGALQVGGPQAGAPQVGVPPGGAYASGGLQQGVVWSSPFGYGAPPGGSENSSSEGAPQSKGVLSPEQQVMNMVLHSVADNFTSQAEKQVAMLQQRFPSFLLSLRPYFSVSQGYVFMRLRQLLFPFLSLFGGPPSARAVAAGSDISSPTAAVCTPERDMYIPLMALTTFVLLVGIQTGTQGGFYPELLGATLSLSLLLLLGEVGALKLSLYITGTAAAGTLDLLCFCGYKYVHVALLLLLRLSLDFLGGPHLASWRGGGPAAASDTAAPQGDSGAAPASAAAAAAAEGGVTALKQGPWLFVCMFAYLSSCAAVELFVLLQRAKAADKDSSSGPYTSHARALRGSCASYVILIAAVAQIPLCWFLLPCKVFAA